MRFWNIEKRRETSACESSKTVIPVLYDKVLKGKNTRDDESAEMLDLIFDGIYYDPALIYSIGKLSELFRADLPKKKENTFVSMYTKYEKAAAKALDKLVEAIETLEH